MDNRNNLYLINWSLLEITLDFLVAFGQLRIRVLNLDLKVTSGGVRTVVWRVEELDAFFRELGMELNLVDRFEDLLIEQLRALCRLSSEQKEQLSFLE